MMEINPYESPRIEEHQADKSPAAFDDDAPLTAMQILLGAAIILATIPVAGIVFTIATEYLLSLTGSEILASVAGIVGSVVSLSFMLICFFSVTSPPRKMTTDH
jgi:hypothetical protein